jgi:PKD repeat protein
MIPFRTINSNDMKVLHNLLISILLLFISVNFSFSQHNYATNIITTTGEEKKLFINYDIVANDEMKFFNVFLELSYGGEPVKFNPLNIYGDYGFVRSAGNKIIYWNYETDFKLDVDKLDVKVYAFPEKEPQAMFRSTSETGNFYAPCKINFTNLSENSDRYEWNFGDVNSGTENSSTEVKPSHTYKNPGSYNVSLTAHNTKSDLNSTFYETVIIMEPAPTIADFEIANFDNLKEQSVPLEVRFNNMSINADNYNWNFGDPGSGEQKNKSRETSPVHLYKKAGTYNIELTARNTLNGQSSVKNLEITLQELAKVATSAYDKHKKMKTIWLIATGVTTATGMGLFLKSNSLYNDYKTATTDAVEIREKYEKLDKIYPAVFGVAILSGAMTIIQTKKQSNATAKLEFVPIIGKDCGELTLKFNF